MPTATLVLTTIFNPIALDGYLENFRTFGHLEDVEVVLIPDRKTPPETYGRCADLRRQGLNVLCPTLDDQERFLARLGLPPEFIPYNSDNRRNLGYLLAYSAGRDFLISIDDDNYCRQESDCFGEHSIVCGGSTVQPVTECESGFLNFCDLLELESAGRVYPRGFPYYRRHLPRGRECHSENVRVHVNAGLWTENPDVDAITWLVAKPRVTAFNGQSTVLGPHTWAPVNSQNTALIHAAIPAYYFVRMRYPISGLTIDRYGDIFSGYFVQACAKHLGGQVRVGTPVAIHRRNSHNYVNDATGEWACILILEDLLPWLTAAHLSGANYIETYRSLSHAVEDAVERFKGPVWTDATRGYFHQMAYHMRCWLQACERLPLAERAAS